MHKTVVEFARHDTINYGLESKKFDHGYINSYGTFHSEQYERNLNLLSFEISQTRPLPLIMGPLVYLICAAVASFAVLAQPAVAQGANNTLPLTYPSRILQGDGSQTCPSEAQRGMLRNEITNA